MAAESISRQTGITDYSREYRRETGRAIESILARWSQEDVLKERGRWPDGKCRFLVKLPIRGGRVDDKESRSAEKRTDKTEQSGRSEESDKSGWKGFGKGQFADKSVTG